MNKRIEDIEKERKKSIFRSDNEAHIQQIMNTL